MAEITEEMMFTNARIEETMYDVTFNPKTREGKIVVNISVVDKKDLDEVWIFSSRSCSADYPSARM